jgi:hypothetical protein
MKAKSKVENVIASYEAPMIEVIDIRLEQNILLSASTGDTPGTPGGPW